MLSEPLSLLVLLAALTLTVLAPAFHYHQFGEATRMARDAGFSAIFTCGSVVAVFVTIRAFRREIESGTMSMALAHPISRGGFFVAKTVGAIMAYLVFTVIVFATEMLIVEGAAIGGLLAKQSGDIARLFGPCLAGGVATMILPLVIGAMLNRFARCRFVLSAFMTALTMSLLGAGFVAFIDPWIGLWLLPVSVAAGLPTLVLLSAAAAFAMRMKTNVAASAVGAVFLLMLPAVGNYYLADALNGGNTVPWSYVGLCALTALPAVAAFAIMGIGWSMGRDIS